MQPKGWAPRWVLCVRIDLPADASRQKAFELATAVDAFLRPIEESVVAHVLFSVNARALLAFEALGLGAIANRIRWLVERERGAFVGTSPDDAILPLLPETEVHRQLALDRTVGRQIFGDMYSPWILWPPALAASPRLARLAAEHGYSGMLVDEAAMRVPVGEWAGERLDSCPGLAGFFLLPVSRRASQAFAEGRIRRSDGWRALGPGSEEHLRYVVTTYGIEPSRAPPTFVRPEDLRQTLRTDELRTRFPLTRKTAPLPSSQYSTRTELAEGLPFALWHHPDNAVQTLQWQLAVRMLIAHEELLALGLAPHPAVAQLRDAIDVGWRRRFWEAANALPASREEVVSGVRNRVRALERVRPLLGEERWADVEDTLQALTEELGADEPLVETEEGAPLQL